MVNEYVHVLVMTVSLAPAFEDGVGVVCLSNFVTIQLNTESLERSKCRKAAGP